jgi:hypothetical protein
MAVDRRFADASAASGGFYGERAIPHFTQLIERRLQNHLPRVRDPRVNSGLRPRHTHLLRLG